MNVLLSIIIVALVIYSLRGKSYGDESSAKIRYAKTAEIDKILKLEQEIKVARTKIVVLSIANEILQDELNELKSKFQ